MVCDSSHKLIRRRDAKAQGVRFYYTGRVCQYGHVALRYVSSGHCVACHIPGIPGNPAHKAMRAAYVPKACVNCGKELPYEQRKRNCCSHSCANQMMWRKKGGKTCRKTCKECGASFCALPSEGYCSMQCRQSARHRLSAKPARYFRRLLTLRSPGRGAAVYRSLLTQDDLIHLYREQQGRCALSGVELTFQSGRGRIPTNCSIDRIDSSRDYTRDNIQLACIWANMMKKNMPQGEFIEWCRKIATTHPPAQSVGVAEGRTYVDGV